MKIGILSVQPEFLWLLSFLLYQSEGGAILLGGLACALHELAHIFVLCWQRNKIKQIRLTLYGAVIELSSVLSYRQELAAAAAGPLCNLLLAAFFCRFPSCVCFTGLNLTLGIFNLLPLGQLDGARILNCLFGLLGFGEWIGFSLEYGLLLFLTVAGVVLTLRYANPTLLLTALWLAVRHFQKNTGNFKKKNGIRACQKVTNPLK